MAILFLVDTISARGGSERACINTANLLAAENERPVIILSIKGKEEPAYALHENVRLISLNYQTGGHFRRSIPKFLWQLRGLLIKEKVTSIIAVEIMNSIFLHWLFLCKLYPRNKIQWIAWEHFNFTVNLGLPIRDRYRKIVAQKADDIVVLTQQDQSMWQENLKLKATIHTIYNVSPFVFSENPYLTQSSPQPPIIAVGRLTYQKGWDRLISLWKRFVDLRPDLAKKNPLWIIGSGEDHEALQAQIKEHQLQDLMTIVQNTHVIEEWYQKAKLLVMTSRFEGLPMVLIEAQSFGLPILAYDCVTGPRDIIIGQSGWLIPENEENQWIEQLINILDQENLDQESESAWQASKRFHASSILASWKKVLQPKKD